MRGIAIAPASGLTPDYDKMALEIPGGGLGGQSAISDNLREGIIDLVGMSGFGRWDGPGHVIYRDTSFNMVGDGVYGRLTYVLEPGESHDEQGLGAFLPPDVGVRVRLGCRIKNYPGQDGEGGDPVVVVEEILSLCMVRKAGYAETSWIAPVN